MRTEDLGRVVPDGASDESLVWRRHRWAFQPGVSGSRPRSYVVDVAVPDVLLDPAVTPPSGAPLPLVETTARSAQPSGTSQTVQSTPSPMPTPAAPAENHAEKNVPAEAVAGEMASGETSPEEKTQSEKQEAPKSAAEMAKSESEAAQKAKADKDAAQKANAGEEAARKEKAAAEKARTLARVETAAKAAATAIAFAKPMLDGLVVTLEKLLNQLRLEDDSEETERLRKIALIDGFAAKEHLRPHAGQVRERERAVVLALVTGTADEWARTLIKAELRFRLTKKAALRFTAQGKVSVVEDESQEGKPAEGAWTATLGGGK